MLGLITANPIFIFASTTATEKLREFRYAMENEAFYPNITYVMEFFHSPLSFISFLLGIIAVLIIMFFIIKISLNVLAILINDIIPGNEHVEKFLPRDGSNTLTLKEYAKKTLAESFFAFPIAALLITGSAFTFAGFTMQVFGSALDTVGKMEFAVDNATFDYNAGGVTLDTNQKAAVKSYLMSVGANVDDNFRVKKDTSNGIKYYVVDKNGRQYDVTHLVGYGR